MQKYADWVIQQNNTKICGWGYVKHYTPIALSRPINKAIILILYAIRKSSYGT